MASPPAAASPACTVKAFAAALASEKERPRAPIHAFHRWYGKLVPAIPAAAIEAFTERGDLVVDPFCGSGTTLVEAVRRGRRATGADVSPLACLLSRAKTRRIDAEGLAAAVDRCARRAFDAVGVEGGDDAGWSERLPSFPNRDHYYPPEVARALLRLFESARAEPDVARREWLLALASAINRDVSNADTRHVFPGVSKRMRALIADGWRADVELRWRRAAAKRLRATEALAAERGPDMPEPTVATASADAVPGEAASAALVVTNPPYVSSIRYVETFKLEAFWLGASPAELRALDERSLGTERVAKGPLDEAEVEAVPQAAAREAVRALAASGEPGRARCVAAWATGLDAALARGARLLRPGGHAVVKLAPSRLRGVIVDSPGTCVESWERHGARLVGSIEDSYDPSSRSLTTARNWYSGRMDSDTLLVFRKDA